MYLWPSQERTAAGNNQWAVQGLVIPWQCSGYETPVSSSSLECASAQRVSAWCLSEESSTTITYCLSYLCCQSVAWRADGAALLSPRMSPDDTGSSLSLCKAAKLFCNGASGFWGSLFLLQVLAIVSVHSSALLAPLPSVCASREVFDCLAVIPLQIVLGVSYSTPS